MKRSTFDQRLVAEIPHLRRYARALTRGYSPAEADDLVQTCLERALSHAAQWDENINLRARLFAIIHNLFVSALRKASSASRVRLDFEAVDSGDPEEESYMEFNALANALDGLPADQREAVILVGLEGMSYEEVAHVMQIPVGTVRSRLSRGREALRTAIGRPASLSKSRARRGHRNVGRRVRVRPSEVSALKQH